MLEEYQIHVQTLISEFKHNRKVELTDYLINCIEECLEDSFKYKDLCD